MANKNIISSIYSKFIIFKSDTSVWDTEHWDTIIWMRSYTLCSILPKYSLFWPLERVIKCNIQNKRKFVDVRAKLFDIRAVSLSKLGINNVTKLFEDSAWDPSYSYCKCCSKGCVRSLSIYQVQLPAGKTSAINQFHCKLLVAGECVLAVKHFVIPFGRLHTFLYTKTRICNFELLWA